ncbi:MAG TPA: dienelactone hydrolase family protein [Kofleriaceae bacterium]|nr:dienelactone hydrolase family protein [Kofleriaceae bacterium]
MGETVTVTAEDGHTFSAYVAYPEGVRRGSLIVVQEIFGVNRHIRSVVDRFAQDGYVTIAPAMFDRFERDVDMGYTADTVAHGRALKAKITTEMAMTDLAAAFDIVEPHGDVGVVGYCWGGFVAWLAAVYLPGITCAVPYYGGGILEHQDLVPRSPVMAHFGDLDPILPIGTVREFIAKHPAHQMFIYAADHGFNCDDRFTYNQAAADLARERTLAFFRQHVG